MTRLRVVLSACVCLFAGCGPSETPQSFLPAQPPERWHVTITIRGTTEMPGSEPHRLVSVYVSGVAAGRLDARRHTPLSRTGKFESVKADLSAEQMNGLYSLTRAAISTHAVGKKPEKAIRDGDSLLIQVRAYDRGLQVGYHHCATVSADVLALLTALNSHLPEPYHLLWENR